MEDEKKVLIYCRESRDDYHKNYDRIKTQRDLLIKFCKNNGYSNIVDIILDDDKSGTDFSRFEEIKRKIQDKKIDVIVFKNSSRLGRNQKESLEFVEYLEENNIEIVFEDEPYDEEMFGIYAWFNERRARDDSKNIRRNLRHKIEEGKLIINPIYGYDKVNKKLVINSETSKVVIKIFKLYSQGKSYKEIIQYLNDNNILTPSQYKNYTNSKKSNNWNYQHIYRIINDIRYTGTYVGGYTEKINFKSKKTRIKSKKNWVIIKNHHDKIISNKLWNNVKLRKKMCEK